MAHWRPVTAGAEEEWRISALSGKNPILSHRGKLRVLPEWKEAHIE